MPPGVTVIAIDGPVAAGKTVVGRALAEALGFAYLDTGVMYRAITWLALHRGASIVDGTGVDGTGVDGTGVDGTGVDGTGETGTAGNGASENGASGNDATLGRLAEKNPVALVGNSSARVRLAGHELGPELREPAVESKVSLVSKSSQVRRALVAQQRALAAKGAMVMVGRDIGTVVLPGAGLKVYLTASPETRARRRWLEMRDRGQDIELETVLSETKRRDEIDSGRADSPLRPATDAWILDTDGLNVDEVVAQIIERVKSGC